MQPCSNVMPWCLLFAQAFSNTTCVIVQLTCIRFRRLPAIAHQMASNLHICEMIGQCKWRQLLRLSDIRYDYTGLIFSYPSVMHHSEFFCAIPVATALWSARSAQTMRKGGFGDDARNLCTQYKSITRQVEVEPVARKHQQQIKQPAEAISGGLQAFAVAPQGVVSVSCGLPAAGPAAHRQYPCGKP
jgi:hypothetical protein